MVSVSSLIYSLNFLIAFFENVPDACPKKMSQTVLYFFLKVSFPCMTFSSPVSLNALSSKRRND